MADSRRRRSPLARLGLLAWSLGGLLGVPPAAALPAPPPLPPEAAALLAAGRGHLAAGRFEQGLADLEDAAALAPDDPLVAAATAAARRATAASYLSRASRHMAGGRYPEALGASESALSLAPDDAAAVAAKARALAHMEAQSLVADARKAFAEGRVGAAAAMVERAIARVPDPRLEDWLFDLRRQVRKELGWPGASVPKKK